MEHLGTFWLVKLEVFHIRNFRTFLHLTLEESTNINFRFISK